MDLQALLHPRIADREALLEFVDDLADHVPEIERNIAQLRRNPHDPDIIASLFRALHTIKGDAAILKVELAVAICHPIESLLARVRSREIGFTESVAEVVLLALDRLELAVEGLSRGRPLEALKLPDLVLGLDRLAGLRAGDIGAGSVAVIEAVTGFRPVAPARDLGGGRAMSAIDHADDLRFFRDLAIQLESRSPLFAGRTDRLLKLAQETNEVAGRPVDPVQLEAAVYLHDVGMMFLPESIWLKAGKLSDDEREQMHRHPAEGAGLLQRMPGWEGAAQMVAQHHEMPDGKGYPLRLADGQICPGAKILAIVDAFESVTLKQSQRGLERSLLRAMAEINACDTQFAPDWIGHFNQVIRRTLDS